MGARIPHPFAPARTRDLDKREGGAAGAFPVGVPLLASLALFAVGLGLRVLPFVHEGGAYVMRRFPTEDGYLTLTIARNIALGLGMSTAAGEMPTNGTQPLVTLLWSVLFRLAGGDRQLGVTLVLVAQIAIAIAAARVLYVLGTRALGERPYAPEAALLGSALWFASPHTVPNGMNCLESGAYALAALLVALAFVEPSGERAAPWSWARCVKVGVLLGAAFWTRNDAVFLIAAACLAHLHGGLADGIAAVRARFARTLVFGSTSVLVASPWLVYNYLNFGHIMPVSGRAESRGAEFGHNLPELPAVLFENVSAIVAIPARVTAHPAVIAGCTVLLVALAVLARKLWANATHSERSLAVLVGLYGAGLVTFYGLFFGAMHFLPRYFFPLTAFFALLWSALLLHATRALSQPVLRAALHLAPIGALVWVAALGVRDYAVNRSHQHFQVVEWVRANVARDTWVGAVQTGTLGFFHDRTINLDGKVNPAAYQALERNQHARYVVDSPVQYLPDWVAIVDWMNEPEIARHFEVRVVDHEKNLAVLARKAPERAGTAPLTRAD